MREREREKRGRETDRKLRKTVHPGEQRQRVIQSRYKGERDRGFLNPSFSKL